MKTDTVPEGYMQDHRGSLIPKDRIKEIDLLRDSLVREIAEKSKEYSRILSDFKAKCMGELSAFIELSAEKYGVHFGGPKGNVMMVSFDGRYRIIRAMNETISFDERLHVAKQLIDECIKEWTDGIRSEIRTIIDHAFSVDKTGKLSTERILSLRRIDIKHDKWKQAMDAISDSITILGSKSYLRIYERDEKGNYKQIALDLAAI